MTGAAINTLVPFALDSLDYSVAVANDSNEPCAWKDPLQPPHPDRVCRCLLKNSCLYWSVQFLEPVEEKPWNLASRVLLVHPQLFDILRPDALMTSFARAPEDIRITLPFVRHETEFAGCREEIMDESCTGVVATHQENPLMLAQQSGYLFRKGSPIE
jgi:hypothetical protein